MNIHAAAMSAPESPDVTASAAPQASRGIVSSGWLAAETTFDPPDRRKMARAMVTSLVSHGLLFFVIIAVMSIKPAVDLLTKNDELPKFVFLQDPGPGGGGGGSPAPAPPKKIEVPKHKAPDPVPVTPTPVPTPPPPIPTLTAPIQTNLSNVLQATGASTVSLATYGGGGRGSGVGSGQGSGVGPGTGGGFGGGAYMPGNGVTNPDVIRSVDPGYTSDAMRNKIQGVMEIEAVVLPNGTVGEMRIVKSIDSKYGLDQQGLLAAKQWLFRPGMKDNEKVAVRVILELTFRLH
jgi:protein TonB